MELLKTKFKLIVLVALIFTFAAMNGDMKKTPVKIQKQDIKSRVNVNMNWGKMPLYFITNKGQTNATAKYYAKASRYTLWLTQQGLVFDSYKRKENSKSQLANHKQIPNNKFQNSKQNTRDVSRLMFVNANKKPEMVAVEANKLKVNFFKGNDKSKWSSAPTSQAVLYKNLYKNIDLKVYGIEKEIEYDWIVKKGADPSTIRFRYDSVKSTRIDKEGNLLIGTRFGDLVHKRPVSYQQIDNKRIPVDVAFKHLKGNTYGFSAAEYDRNYPLIIDPIVLAYSTYLGGDLDETANHIFVDGSGNVYVSGRTYSTDFPLDSQYMMDPLDADYDVFVAKIDPSQSGGDSLLYSTYLGGDNRDMCYGADVDGSGNVYVTGYTRSADYPILNEYQSALSGTSDAFVSKFDPNQSGVNSLVYSSYLGGTGNDLGCSVSLNSNFLYVSGTTESADFPLRNEYDAGLGGGSDPFVVQMDLSLVGANQLLYSTYLGGGDRELFPLIDVDAAGIVYMSGLTVSTDFPTVNEYMLDPGDLNYDMFVVKLDITLGGAGLLYSTYLGGDSLDYLNSIKVDGTGNVYICGYSGSADFPIVNEYMVKSGATNMIIAKIDTNQSGTDSLLFSTYLNGSSSSFAYGLDLDGNNYVYLIGHTSSTDFPLVNQYMGEPGDGEDDVIVAILDLTQSGTDSLLFSTYLGGTDEDSGSAIATDGNGNIYIAGETESTDFPVNNEYMLDPGDSDEDVFISHLSLSVPTVTTDTVTNIFANSAECGGEVTDNGGFSVSGRGLCWSTSTSPTIADDTLVIGSGNGLFSGSFSGLAANTIYYLRAYATNYLGTGYGNQVSFTTGTATIATVTTDAAYNIALTTAAGGGNVTSDGGATVTARGLCWNTSGNPTTSDTTQSIGTGTGTFSGTLTPLTQSTTYYVRAYAVNSVGTAYGNQVSFTTTTAGTVTIPTVTTDAAYNITTGSADSGGNVISDGGATVTSRGLCWSTSAYPTTSDFTQSGAGGTGSFMVSITGLTENTTYYARAYAVNSAGTAYGNQISFTTSSSGTLATVTTDAASTITESSADCGGNVTSEGSSAVIISGLCYGTSADPEFSDTVLVLGSGIGPFTTTISGLAENTTYYVRAFALNFDDTAYGNEVSFTTSEQNTAQLVVDERNLYFGASNFTANAQAVSGRYVTDSQVVYVNVTGSGTIDWNATVGGNASWLSCSPASGSGVGAVTVSINASTLAKGSYSASVTISGGEQSFSIPVNLTVYDTTENPIGSFETPTQGSTVRSSVPVTGWALDDVDVQSVKIYRSPVTGEGGTQIYIGDAAMVDGARPDVEDNYPTYPKAYQAGWGYMLLTHFLPNGGNGTFTLYAKAVDAEGNETTLGSKTITVDNANAVKPFGAIDTPTRGGSASGSSFANYAWALTPVPNTIPTDGSTITVYVDGVAPGNPVYNQYREDISTLFPGYNDSNGAAGYFQLDTTAYTNGVHTISWSVKDDAGNSDGIGSRYFTINNSGNNRSISRQSASNPGQGVPTRLIASAGKNADVINVRIKETERIRVQLGDSTSHPVAGYLLTKKGYRSLPIGSTLDIKGKIFSWQPGPGFYGLYKFVFVEKDGSGRLTGKRVNVKISAKY
ncbi:MAG: hypothetical protein GY765_31340 [bacterium]|nr:hypothetical protein [bacterium]